MIELTDLKPDPGVDEEVLKHVVLSKGRQLTLRGTKLHDKLRNLFDSCEDQTGERINRALDGVIYMWYDMASEALSGVVEIVSRHNDVFEFTFAFAKDGDTCDEVTADNPMSKPPENEHTIDLSWYP